MKKKLAVFDLDGTLFDTREVNFEAYKKALQEYHIDLDRDYFFKNCNGKHYKDFLPVIIGNKEYIDKVHLIKKSIYCQYLDKARENTHLFSIIENICNEYYISLVTTASRVNCEEILCYFNRLYLFDNIISQEDVEKKKPDPEGFLRAMQYFDISPQDTIIFEDSDVGIEAAEKSGATVFTIKGFS